MQSLLKKLALKIVLTMCMTFALLIPQTVKAMPEIMPLEQVKSGMSGIAYTVVDGSGVIEPFNVDIIGLMDNGKGSSKLIMAKASGAIIEKTGGVLQGMSGSPVYIDGKLVGALSAGLKEMSPYTFFITPIESMLPLWNMPDPKAANKYQQIALKNKEEAEKAAETANESKKTEIDVNALDIKTQPDENNIKNEESDKSAKNKDDKKSKKDKSKNKKTDKKSLKNNDKNSDKKSSNESSNDTNISDSTVETKGGLFFSGFDNNGANFLTEEFKSLGMQNFYASATTGEGRQIDYDAKLEPGSAVGVAVVYGDFAVGATGTVTAVEGKKILGFGHSFTHAGNVNFFMTDAAIVGSVSGETGSGMKVANMGNIIGRINQDRDAGIAGIIGKFPSVVPITVTIKDNSLNKTETYNANIAYNENLIPKLGAAIAYTALSKTADSLAESTVDVSFGIKTNVVSSGKLERQNMFYNAADVGQVAVLELMQALNIVCSNTSEESDIFGINVDMSLNNERRTASLVSAVPDKLKVKPGETVNLTVTLQPYRKKSEQIVIPYTVPVTMREGSLTLDIHGGALISVAQVLANAGIIVSTENNDVAKNYSDKINDFLNNGKNNQLVIEPGSSTEPKTERELKREIERIKKAQEKALKAGKKTTSSETKFDTDYIIDNVIHTVIEVEKI